MNRHASARHASAAPLRRHGVRAPRKSGVGGTLIGLFIGIALGIGLATAVAFYLMKTGNPYQASVAPGARDAARDTGRPGRPEPGAAEKPRFEFYKILPGIEEPRPPAKSAERLAGDRATAERALAPDKAAPAREEPRPAAAERSPEKTAEAAPGAAKPNERFWLQAGSFASEGDAENLKAQLALSGWEATLQQANVQDRGVRYRVRLGPYASAEEMNRARAELGKRGFEVSAIRN